MGHLDKLIRGFGNFRENYFCNDTALYDHLTCQGQSPKTLVIGCCDSRVDPAIVTACEPGELFIIRNVANLVPPCEHGGAFHGTSAALEFGVRHLEVEDIIVLGHAQCGGIQSLLARAADETPPAGFIDSWMQVARNARNRVLSRMGDAPGDEIQRACEQEAILVSLDNLLTFPWILERVVQRKLTLHGWYFDLAQGELFRFNPDVHRFEPLAADRA